MIDKFTGFINRHDSFILTTHDPADADGIGAEMVLTCILRGRGKQARIINASPVPEHFRFMDPLGQVEQWDEKRHGALPEQGGLIIVDTADEANIGQMGKTFSQSREVFVIDHHEPKPNAAIAGIYDPTSASVCELVVEMAKAAGTTIDPTTAFAAYIGIAFDTGFFAYPKTGPRTFRAALSLLELGVNPSDAYIRLCQSGSTTALQLQKKAVLCMTLHCGNKIATQVLRREDFAETGALPEETDGLVNFPLKSREVVVSLLVKETPEKKVRCSLRSKGTINVAKIAEEFGGGGHINAAGYKSNLNVDQTLEVALAKIISHLDGP